MAPSDITAQPLPDLTSTPVLLDALLAQLLAALETGNLKELDNTYIAAKTLWTRIQDCTFDFRPRLLKLRAKSPLLRVMGDLKAIHRALSNGREVDSALLPRMRRELGVQARPTRPRTPPAVPGPSRPAPPPQVPAPPRRRSATPPPENEIMAAMRGSLPDAITRWQPPPAQSRDSSAAAPRIPPQAQHAPTTTGPQTRLPPRNGPPTSPVPPGHSQVLAAAARPLRLVPAARTLALAPPAPPGLRTAAPASTPAPPASPGHRTAAPSPAPAPGLSSRAAAASANKPPAPTRPRTPALAKPAQPAPTSRPNSTVPARNVRVADPLPPRRVQQSFADLDASDEDLVPVDDIEPLYVQDSEEEAETKAKRTLNERPCSSCTDRNLDCYLDPRWNACAECHEGKRRCNLAYDSAMAKKKKKEVRQLVQKKKKEPKPHRHLQKGSRPESEETMRVPRAPHHKVPAGARRTPAVVPESEDSEDDESSITEETYRTRMKELEGYRNWVDNKMLSLVDYIERMDERLAELEGRVSVVDRVEDAVDDLWNRMVALEEADVAPVQWPTSPPPLPDFHEAAWSPTLGVPRRCPCGVTPCGITPRGVAPHGVTPCGITPAAASTLGGSAALPLWRHLPRHYPPRPLLLRWHLPRVSPRLFLPLCNPLRIGACRIPSRVTHRHQAPAASPTAAATEPSMEVLTSPAAAGPSPLAPSAHAADRPAEAAEPSNAPPGPATPPVHDASGPMDPTSLPEPTVALSGDLPPSAPHLKVIPPTPQTEKEPTLDTLAPPPAGKGKGRQARSTTDAPVDPAAVSRSTRSGSRSLTPVPPEAAQRDDQSPPRSLTPVTQQVGPGGHANTPSHSRGSTAPPEESAPVPVPNARGRKRKAGGADPSGSKKKKK
ncbi:hypothetical protein LshimejAT787_0410930 [Lyophyllum shimeji]|uniref:Zn(2)-C6 fungal-type domain-containing protein n=1 Tax=Lyophyllum shimeji TaxID=47721 RepID=A0A9P3PMJ4_LYOSH|nr:hypothetical protein LshimejAT787_0410930 [Lyophyllum shimeji]